MIYLLNRVFNSLKIIYNVLWYRKEALPLLFSIFLLPALLNAQKLRDEVKKQEYNKKKYEVDLADNYFKNQEFYMAAMEYEKAVRSDTSNTYALFQLAESHRLYFNYKQAEIYFRSCSNTLGKESLAAKYWYALMLKTNGKYVEAQKEFNQYLTAEKKEKSVNSSLVKEAQLELNGCALALNEMKKPVRDYHFENIPGPLNTAASEYSPTVFNNDTVLVITSGREESTGSKENKILGGSLSDNYRFIKANNKWDANESNDNFSSVNTKYNESAGSFNYDKSKFYFTRCDEPIKSSEGKEFQCGILMTRLIDGKWTVPARLNPNINTVGDWNAQPSISPKGDTLFFVSKRAGGKGMHDIWYSLCNADDNWGPAVNMGDSINTPGVEMSPYYYAKESTLFFASNGREGFGGLDIYKARQKNFGQVSTTGLPFNSSRDDFYLTLGENKGFLSSNREGGAGSDDIYTFNIQGEDAVIAEINRDSMPMAKSISIQGKLLNATTKVPAEDVEVVLKDSNNVALKKTVTDEQGHFKYDNLPANQNYKITLNDSIKSFTNEVKYISNNVKVKGSDSEVSRKFFEDIFYDFNRYELRPEAEKTLDDLVKYYKVHPSIQIEMDANTDNKGSDEYNKKLSLYRGQEALDYLIAHGVKKSSLVMNALGKDKPLVPNNNHIARQLNRRVEFFIVGGVGDPAVAMAYVIEPYMNVYKVAKNFGMSVKDLKKLNNLKSDSLKAYAPLRVKRSQGSSIIAPITYTHLTDKDIEESILHPEAILLSETEMHNLALKHGHELRPGEEYYMVERNNTVFSIAKLNNMTVRELVELNSLQHNQIYIGQKLKVKMTK